MDETADGLAGESALTRAHILARIGERLPREEGAIADLDPISVDFDLNPGMRRLIVTDELKPSAVLVGLVDRGDHLTILLTRRAAHLKSHAGQISFPGGRIEPEDVTFADTALRETWEEVGIPRELVSVLGYVEPYETVTGYRIVPVVGLIRPDFDLVIDPGEVAEAFEVPASFLLDCDNHEQHQVEYRGSTRSFYAIPYKDYYIWGATAAMLVHLSRRLFG